MIITALHTPKITADSGNIFSVLDAALPATLEEGTVLAVTSKIVSICEGSIEKIGDIDKHDLIIREAEQYAPAELAHGGRRFTILKHTLISSAGIDESNGDGYYILWPKNPQQSANDIRRYISENYGLKQFGVVITDSASTLMRRGAVGIALAHSGFDALHNYVGTEDLFGKQIQVSQANISGGLAAASVLAMGEGSEQTPLCLLEDLNQVEFQQRDPTPEELAEITITPETDIFAPFIQGVDWQPGGASKTGS